MPNGTIQGRLFDYLAPFVDNSVVCVTNPIPIRTQPMNTSSYPTFIEVDAQEGANCQYSVNRVFSAVAQPVPVVRVEAPGPRGDVSLYQVTGWSTEGPCPAYAVPVEDSGEGMALLVYGGDNGIRLKPTDSLEPWNLESGEQWGEPCLLLDADAEIKVAEAGR